MAVSTEVQDGVSRHSYHSTLPFFAAFLEAYEETVDAIVDMQTQTWNYVPRYKSFDESKVDGTCGSLDDTKGYSNIPKFERGSRFNTTNDDEWTVTNEMQQDLEADIDIYLKRLASDCSRDIDPHEIGSRMYQERCLDFLKSLVYDPRCTSRCDSRVICNGTQSDSVHIEKSSKTLIQEHFMEDSLNIVIVGAGPIGLILANAISMLHKRGETKDIPHIRILMIETRADAPGVKTAYTRNWQAQLSLLHFRDTVDPRVTSIFASMTDQKDDNHSDLTDEFVVPLNVIETMFYLSTRDLGVTKFLFGINPLEVVNDLKDVRNLVFVDATGHRLEPLERGSVCKDASTIEEVPIHIQKYQTPAQPDLPWINVKNSEFYDNFMLDFSHDYDFFEKHGHAVYVGKTGNLLFPIEEKTNVAKSMYWLDIHGATPYVDMDEHNEYQQATGALYANEGAFCEFCEHHFETQEQYGGGGGDQEQIDILCDDMCYCGYITQSTSILRDDIRLQLIRGSFSRTFVTKHSTDEAWFPLNGYTLNPSKELAKQINAVLDENGYYGHPVGMPLRKLVPALEELIETSKQKLSQDDNDMLVGIKRWSNHNDQSDSDWPAVTLGVQQPFIYTNGFKPKKKMNNGDVSFSIGDFFEDAPMIRFGDSFTTGDGLHGSGMYTHATMIGVFMDAILYKTGSKNSDNKVTTVSQ